MTNPTTNSDEFVIKLQGKAHLFDPLKIGHNYELHLKGSITEEKKQDKDDGGFIFTWKFEPVTCDVVNELGEKLKTRDMRKRSVQLRSALARKWREENSAKDSEDYYDNRMLEIIKAVIEDRI